MLDGGRKGADNDMLSRRGCGLQLCVAVGGVRGPTFSAAWPRNEWLTVSSFVHKVLAPVCAPVGKGYLKNQRLSVHRRVLFSKCLRLEGDTEMWLSQIFSRLILWNLREPVCSPKTLITSEPNGKDSKIQKPQTVQRLHIKTPEEQIIGGCLNHKLRIYSSCF